MTDRWGQNHIMLQIRKMEKFVHVGLRILLDAWKFRFTMCLFTLNFNIFSLNKFNKGWKTGTAYNVIPIVVKAQFMSTHYIIFRSRLYNYIISIVINISLINNYY